MSFETVEYEASEGIARITLNRPERLNAMTSELIEGLHRALDAVAADHSPSDDELRAHCARDLARYKIPKDFVRREFVQRSPSGKPDYGWARAQLDA